MNARSDLELLGDYVERGAEAAFAELVERHVGLVYSTAVRLVVDPHLAEDIAQAVFIALARNARELQGRQVLSSWLHLTTRNIAANTVRREVRRRVREQEAAMTPMSTPEPEAIWAQIAPHLDGALAELNDADRDALMLRFFERKTAREIGEHLGVAEDAAQKRVERALDRLRAVMAARGVAVSVIALAAAVSLPAANAAPPGLAATLTAKALAGAGASTSLAGVTKGINVMAQLKSHPAVAAAVVLACLSLGTAGFVTGKAAARKHYSAVAWQQAVLRPSPASSEGPAAADAPVADASRVAVSRPSVREILAEAADYFRSDDADDGWVKGCVALEKLQIDETQQAIEQLEFYRNEPGVFNRMAPRLMGLWAQTDPQAAVQYATARLDATLSISLKLICAAWAKREPAAVWTWYRESMDAGKLPRVEGQWQSPIFTEWAARDAAGAFDQLAKVSSADEPAAINGISDAARNSENRPAILTALARLPDERQRRRMAEAIARHWADMEPDAAVRWAATLEFENPGARVSVIRNVLAQWSRLDPHAAAVWALTQAPAELLKGLQPNQLDELRKAAK